MTYKEENNIVLENFFNRSFFDSWAEPRRGKGRNVYNSIEIYLTTDCNLSCKYCYLNRHEDRLYPKELRDDKIILRNLGLMIDYLIDNHYTPRIDIFSGAGAESTLGINALNLIYEKYALADIEDRPGHVSLPTNFTFILDDKLTKQLEEIKIKFNAIDINVGLSVSVDGKYMEENRPFRNEKRVNSEMLVRDKNNDPRDDEYYDKMFTFAKKHHAGFHPMVYSRKIEDWKQNFLWFQEQFEKYDIPFDNIYLLEIRNAEWTDEQLYHYSEFLEFLID